MIAKKWLLILVFFVGGCVATNKLNTYKQKRDFSKTAEPKGVLRKKTVTTKKKQKPKSEGIFVIQKHDASHLHYDLRLEIDGVLKSWAVPKGPSLNPAVKRLAVETEDHPYDYAHFEGTIPEGEYGGGSVMIWDNGTYDNIKEKNGKIVPMSECYKNGQIEFFLHGKKLKGGFALVRTHLAGGKEGRSWLLIKMNDEYASKKKNPVSTQDKSVVTGRSTSEIAHDQD